MTAIAIGQATPGSATFTVGANEYDLTRFYVPAAGTIDSIKYYAGTSSITMMPVIYSSTAVMGNVGSRLWYGSEVTIAGNGTTTVSPALAIGSAQEVWIGWHAKLSTNAKGLARGDVNAAGSAVNCTYFGTATYGTPPAGPINGAANYGNTLQLDITFTPTTDTDRTLYGTAAPTAASNSSISMATDEINLQQITFASAVSVNKLRLWGRKFQLNANFKPIIYVDSGGVPGARSALGPAYSGLKPGANDLPFSSDISLSAGTYWFGFVPDRAVSTEAEPSTTYAGKFKAVAGQYATVPDPAPGSMSNLSASPGFVISASSTATTRRRPIVALLG